MKRFLMALLVLILAFACVFSFASCEEKKSDSKKEEKLQNIGDKPELDLTKAEDALKGAGYEVYYETEPQVGYEESIYATKGDNLISISHYKTEDLAKIYYKEMKLSYDMEVEYLKLMIEKCQYIIDNYSDDLSSSELDEYEDELRDYERELEKLEDKTSLGISKNIVWYGTNDGAEATQETD